MISFLLDFITDYCRNNKLYTIEGVDNFNDKKLAIVLTYNNIKMISIELLPNGICDLLVVDIESEDILFMKTIGHNSIDELKNTILVFLNQDVFPS